MKLKIELKIKLKSFQSGQLRIEITIYDNRLDYFHTNQGRLIIELWTQEAGKSNPNISCDNTGPFGPSLYDTRIRIEIENKEIKLKMNLKKKAIEN